MRSKTRARSVTTLEARLVASRRDLAPPPRRARAEARCLRRIRCEPRSPAASRQRHGVAGGGGGRREPSSRAWSEDGARVWLEVRPHSRRRGALAAPGRRRRRRRAARRRATCASRAEPGAPGLAGPEGGSPRRATVHARYSKPPATSRSAPRVEAEVLLAGEREGIVDPGHRARRRRRRLRRLPAGRGRELRSPGSRGRHAPGRSRCSSRAERRASAWSHAAATRSAAPACFRAAPPEGHVH